MPIAPIVSRRKWPTLENSQEIFYPESDGKPMAETDVHVDVEMYALSALRGRYAGTDTYVAANNFLYYQEGNPSKRVSPDTYVVFGAGQHKCRTFRVWKEQGRTPAVVFEFTSLGTKAMDEGKKRRIYEQILQVPEYFQFDPTGDYLRVPLKVRA